MQLAKVSPHLKRKVWDFVPWQPHLVFPRHDPTWWTKIRTWNINCNRLFGWLGGTPVADGRDGEVYMIRANGKMMVFARDGTVLKEWACTSDAPRLQNYAHHQQQLLVQFAMSLPLPLDPRCIGVRRNEIVTSQHHGLDVRTFRWSDGVALSAFGKRDFLPGCVSVTPNGRVVVSDGVTHQVAMFD